MNKSAFVFILVVLFLNCFLLVICGAIQGALQIDEQTKLFYLFTGIPDIITSGVGVTLLWKYIKRNSERKKTVYLNVILYAFVFVLVTAILITCIRMAGVPSWK